ncbi:hypothetical protein CONLIGDRAFT_678472 [Coniochaeta ligniaria NRRL 30616]|uniref:Uncharacterized protein n=1 Tax=Coniochaeta ligniaria NRRL 30616 TaxID=1408157 RepID=A0A1J7JQ25_9PEZI|nr:hypothetical protein CONLIGDRAFT_678472 [Coniochaeta ligniaria NRRL 30616]
MDRPSSSDRRSQEDWSPSSFDFKESTIETTLTLPQYDHENVPGASPPPGFPDGYPFKARLAAVSTRLRELRPVILTYGISLLFGFLYCWFIIVVLIYGRVETPFGVFWEASTTNLVVSVLSQISAYLTDATLKSFLGILRTVFMTRPDGSSFESYVGLGEASGFLTVFQVAAMNWFINPWCNFRLSLPVLCLAFGSVLKFMATFQYYFVASNVTMTVYAGLIPLDVGVMRVVSQADICMFFELWSSNLLSNSRYALEFPFAGCDGDCRSFIMPGGLEAPRQVKQFLNETLLSGGTFDNSETLRISNATGFILKFEKPDANLTFDLVQDCVYGGAQENNGLQICMKQYGQSIDFGWAACPKNLLDNNLCNSNTTWRSGAMSSTTRMTAFKQLTTTSYNRRNGSIVDIEIPQGAVPVPINTSASDYKTVFRAILTPGPNATLSDKSNINALIYAMTWSHRTYVKSFPDDKDSTTSNLRNVLAVPFQHTMTATIFGNYTASEHGLKAVTQFILPDEMITTATGGTSRSRLAILRWTGWLFVAGDATVHLVVFAGLVWVVLREGRLPQTVGLGDIQVPRAAQQTFVLARKPRWRLPIWSMKTEPVLPDFHEGEVLPFLEVAERPDVCDEKKNTWQLARMLRGVRLLHPMEDVEKNAGRPKGLDAI